MSTRLIGEIFVEKGIITEQQLELALEEQRASGERLGEILVARFGVARLDVASVLAEQWAEYERLSTQEQPKELSPLHLAAVRPELETPPEQAADKRPIGEIFVERGLVTEDQLQDALELQKQTGQRLGEILVTSGKLSRLDLASALADQWAAFQKLRPPASSASASARDHVLPVPEVTAPDPPAADVAVAEIRDALHQLGARVDSLAQEARGWEPAFERAAERLRQDLAALGARVDVVADVGDWRPEVASLRETVEQVAAHAAEQPVALQECRLELGQVADNLRARLERVEQGVSAAVAQEALDGVRREVAELRAALESLPPPSEEWREALAALEERLGSLPAPSEEWREALAALGERVERLPLHEWRGELAEVSDNLRERLERVEQAVGSLPGTEAIEELRSELAGLRAAFEAAPGQPWQGDVDSVRDSVGRLSERVEALAGSSQESREALTALAARVDSLPRAEGWLEAVAALERRIDEPERGLDELRAAAAQLSGRIAALEQAAGSAAWQDALEALRAALDERAEALEARIDQTGATHASRLERELEELRALIADGERRATDRAQQAVEQVRSQLAGALEAAVSRQELDELRGELAAHGQQTEERAAGARAELDGVHARLDHVEAVLAHATSWPVALEPLQARLDEVDARLEALAASRRAEHEAELADLRADLTARLDEVADARPARDELEGVRARLEEMAARIETRDAREDAAAEAAERAIRDGLAELARRLTASESAHLESGRLLRESIEGLGLALVDADARVRGLVRDDPAAPVAGYVAFAPTPEGYRLVEREGAVPLVGQVLDDVTGEGPLRVTRLGRSPLPFDRRPCAYLERAV